MGFPINHHHPPMVRRRWAMVVVALLFVVAWSAVAGNAVTKLAYGSVDDASAHPSARARSTNTTFRPSAHAGMQTPRLTPTLVSVRAPAPLRASRRVVLFGDSLAWEAQAPFRVALAAAGITQVTTRSFGGTAICDWVPQMRADQAQLHPDAVVIEFSGDEFTPCMQDPAGHPFSGTPYFEKYSEDARTAIRIFTSDATLVYFAGSPISRQAEQSHDPDAGRLNHLYESMAAADPNVRYIDAGAAVLDRGHWTGTLGCLPEEPCTGGSVPDGPRVNIVRAPDGNHFCPVAPPAVHGVTNSCPIWSSGAYRYGTAMAAPVIVDLTRVSGGTRSASITPGGSKIPSTLRLESPS